MPIRRARCGRAWPAGRGCRWRRRGRVGEPAGHGAADRCRFRVLRSSWWFLRGVLGQTGSVYLVVGTRSRQTCLCMINHSSSDMRRTDDRRHHRAAERCRAARILDTAIRLFYARGLRAVGVDTIIAESGVAKATFYKYFPAKDDLIAGLPRPGRRRSGPASCTPRPRRPARRRRTSWSGLFDALGSACRRDGYRGCGFINAAAETDAGHGRARPHRRAQAEGAGLDVATWRGDAGAPHPEARPLAHPAAGRRALPAARSTPTRRPSRWPGIPRPTWSSRLSPPEGRPPSRGRAGSTACRSLTAGPRGTETARPERNLLPVPARQFRCARRSRLG